jgi:protein-S-isoprenylcysteine O-methyltransferase Ste14
MAAVLVPVLILSANGSHIGWWSVLGVALAGVGLLLMARAIALFAREGRGTLAPWDPTSRLVVRGPYRHVRNPMISGVMFLLAGEAAFFGSWALAVWFACFVLVNAVWIPLVEEPGLERRFGEDYLVYREAVPRWIPRLRAWTPPGDG